MATTNRDEKMKEITDRLQAGLEELFNSEKYAEYLRVMSQFYHYSFNNTLLIAMQKPDATLVAGYRAWERKFNRHVLKGEKGIQIIAPAPVKEKHEQEKLDPATGEAVLREDGQPDTEEVTIVIPRFKVSTVFDLSQTEGDPLPELGSGELTASVENYEIFMKAIRSVSPVSIRFDIIPSAAKGYYDNSNKEIVIQSGMSEMQTMKTAVHEVAHAILHDKDIMQEQGIQKDKMTKEVEAESVAFVSLAHFELDTSDYSFPYIAGWSSSRDAKELKASLDTIRNTSSEIIDGIEESMREQLRARDELAVGYDAGFITVQRTDTGYDYTVYDLKCCLIDGGVLEAPDLSIQEAMNEILRGEGLDASNTWEANYNTIMLEAEKAEAERIPKEPAVKYYVAENMEFPVMGEYHETATWAEAVKLFTEDPNSKMSGIGITLDEESIPIAVKEKGMTKMTDLPVAYSENPLVQQVFTEIKQHFPEGQENDRQQSKPQKSQTADHKENNKKESVLQALKERQTEIKEREKQAPKKKKLDRKKGEQAL